MLIQETNKPYVTGMIHDHGGRLTIRDKDRRWLLALFSKGLDKKIIKPGGNY